MNWYWYFPFRFRSTGFLLTLIHHSHTKNHGSQWPRHNYSFALSCRARARQVRPVLRESSGGHTRSWGRCMSAPSPMLDPTDPLEENWDTKFWVGRLHLINEEIQNAVTLPNSRDIWGTNCPQALLFYLRIQEQLPPHLLRHCSAPPLSSFLRRFSFLSWSRSSLVYQLQSNCPTLAHYRGWRQTKAIFSDD